MGQAELLNLLKKRNKWMLAIEIRKELQLAAGAINRLIKICYESGDIKRKPAIDVIKDKKRLKLSTIKASAYRLKN